MTDRDEAARRLAHLHYELEPEILRIYQIDAAQEPTPPPIRLLEVSEGTPPSGILPLHFGPAPEIPFPSVIIAVTPEEFRQIQDQALALPEGWTVGAEVPREAG